MPNTKLRTPIPNFRDLPNRSKSTRQTITIYWPHSSVYTARLGKIFRGHFCRGFAFGRNWGSFCVNNLESFCDCLSSCQLRLTSWFWTCFILCLWSRWRQRTRIFTWCCVSRLCCLCFLGYLLDTVKDRTTSVFIRVSTPTF